MKVFTKSFLLLVLFSLLSTSMMVRANEEVEDEEDNIVNDDPQAATNQEVPVATESEAEPESLSSPFVKTNLLFVKPESSTNLPAGKLARLLVSFQNTGKSSFQVESIDGSFRFPQDFSYHIQNFSAFEFNQVIDSEKEGTFEFAFTPSETFSQRQFGLTINLRYRDEEGKSFVNSVFNETVSIVEPDEGFDGETFFLYIFLAAVVVLLAVAGQHFFSIFGKKKSRSTRPTNVQKSSNGNVSSSNDVDFEWIPKEHLQTSKSPKTSPRQRKAKAGAGSGNSSNDEQ